MAVLMSLGGNSAGDGFLVAPTGSTYDADITLSTDAGNASVTLQASPNADGQQDPGQNGCVEAANQKPNRPLIFSFRAFSSNKFRHYGVV